MWRRSWNGRLVPGWWTAASFPISSVVDHAESENTLRSNSVTHAHMCTHTRRNKQRLCLACLKELRLHCWTLSNSQQHLGQRFNRKWRTIVWSYIFESLPWYTEQKYRKNKSVFVSVFKGKAAVYGVAIFTFGLIFLLLAQGGDILCVKSVCGSLLVTFVAKVNFCCQWTQQVLEKSIF